MMKKILPVFAMTALVVGIVPVLARAQADNIATAPNGVHASTRSFGGACSGTIVYDTTHAATQGAELAPTANGAATNLSDRIVIAGTDRFVCGITVEVFTLASVVPFDMTMRLWTDCTTSGAGNTPCGNGPGTLIPNSTVTVTGITPPALGTIFAVTFPYPNVDLSSEADNTISVALNPSRNDVFWRIGETPVVGSLPAGEPATSFVERCGSVAANNGCQRNFGVNNNFAIQIEAMTTPVELMEMKVE
jgi:hypothetical protein